MMWLAAYKANEHDSSTQERNLCPLDLRVPKAQRAKAIIESTPQSLLFNLLPLATMTNQQRTPLVRVLNSVTIASFLVVFLTAHVVYTKPVISEELHEARHGLLSKEEALVPKTIENDAAVAPLSPVHEEARRRWNRAKQLHHLLQPKRYIRNVVEPRSTTENANASVPKYILELYENLTQSKLTEGKLVEQRTTRANTVRSIEAVTNGEYICNCTQL